MSQDASVVKSPERSVSGLAEIPPPRAGDRIDLTLRPGAPVAIIRNGVVVARGVITAPHTITLDLPTVLG